MAMDALAALDYLQGLASVKHDRIAVAGWSYGGAAVLTVAAYQNERLLGQRPPERRFRAAIAFYPRCSALSTVSVPTQLLLAGEDESTPPAECVSRGQQLRRNGSLIDWVVYPGAYHAFDHPHIGTATIQFRGETLRYDASATTQAQNKLRQFLYDHLTR